MNRTATTAATQTGFSLKAALVAVLSRIVEADRRYREAQKLRRMPDYRLKDVGLSRRDADTAFLKKNT